MGNFPTPPFFDEHQGRAVAAAHSLPCCFKTVLQRERGNGHLTKHVYFQILSVKLQVLRGPDALVLASSREVCVKTLSGGSAKLCELRTVQMQGIQGGEILLLNGGEYLIETDPDLCCVVGIILLNPSRAIGGTARNKHETHGQENCPQRKVKNSPLHAHDNQLYS